MKTINFSDKQNIAYCIPTSLRDEQIKINLSKVKGRLEPNPEINNEPIALVAFAPSLANTWKQLKRFKYVMTCSGAHKFLLERGIIPTWHVDLEPREHKIKMLGTPHKDVQYLIASTVHPRYFDQLKGHDVKLWHIFANEADGARVLPRGEWQITGGSSVGLRCMTLARFLGFTNLHIFGMDGSFSDIGSHADVHPNTPKERYETEYKGKKYITTPSMLFCAKETARELDQMPGVTAKFYGTGLLQDMMKDYVPQHHRPVDIAYNKPKLISDEYIKLNHQLHVDNPNYGMGGARHVETVLKMYNHPDINSILDYGCGKGQLANALPFPIWEYDPAIPEKASVPKPADLVVCTDVLEHIEQDKINFVLDDLRRVTNQIGYFVISTRKAIKTYANGQNTHNIVQGKDWWHKKLSKFFTIGTIVEGKDELQIVVSPKVAIQPDITSIEYKDKVAKFYTPNDTTKWRANTLLTKEPVTVEWIGQMQPGEVMYDIGANIGSYSILAGINGVKVYSFEPEAENYSLLVKNMQLNDIEPNAYCLAISDEHKVGTLYGGQRDVGGACHSFGEQVGYDLHERKAAFTQGCMGLPLDSMITNGLPHPQHIKIDVDGFEFKVIKGATNILANGIKSILVEVNTNLPEHIKMIDHLCSIGFTYDQEQVDRATRKEGSFKGVAEYIFTKKQSNYLVDKIKEAELIMEPFPHFFIENVFPKDVYADILANMPDNYIEIEKSRGTRGYPKRFTSNPTGELWDGVLSNVRGMKAVICEKFGISGNYTDDTLLIRDKKGYQISPHTDTPAKVVSALFYLPKKEHKGAGTNIYIPKQEGLTCKSGMHYSFDDFEKVKGFPYKPNSLLVFLRTDNSFHGVEPSPCERNVLLYNIRRSL
jgi:FkbM family methyltransferase